MNRYGRFLLCCMGIVMTLGPMSAFGTVIETFTTNVLGDDPFTGNSYVGTFSYDETVLSGIGNETIGTVSGAVTVDFTFEGQQFDETNDLQFDRFPTLTFSDGAPIAIDFRLVNGSSGVDFTDPTISEVRIQNELNPVVGGGFIVDARVETAQVVPVPAALPLFACALGGLGFLGRRLKKPIQRPVNLG